MFCVPAGELCRSKKVFLHTDAAQAVGKIPVDVNAMNIDLMSISGHKIYGPKGVCVHVCVSVCARACMYECMRACVCVAGGTCRCLHGQVMFKIHSAFVFCAFCCCFHLYISFVCVCVCVLHCAFYDYLY